jgi:hypothetical protein
MKKRTFVLGLAALLLAAMVFTSCGSAADGAQGPAALPAQTATTLDGINKFFAEGYGTVYLVGEVTLGEGQTLTIPNSHSVIVTSTGDLNGRTVAPDGKGKITLNGGTISVGTSSSVLRFREDSTFTYISGAITGATGSGSIVIDDINKAVVLLDNDAFVAAAGSALIGIGDMIAVDVSTTAVVSAAPTSASSTEIANALTTKALVLYTNATGLTATNIGVNIADLKSLIVTNPAATVTISGATLTVGTSSTGASLSVAGNIVVGNDATPANNITLVGPVSITTGNGDSVALNGTNETVALNGNTHQPILAVGGDSAIGAGLKIVVAQAGTPATLATKTTGDIITLTGGAVGTSKIGMDSGDGLVLVGGSIVAYNTGTTAITTFSAGGYVTTATAASLLLSTGVIDPNSDALTLSEGATITTKDATTLTPANLALVRHAAVTSAASPDVVFTAVYTNASTSLNGFTGAAKFNAGYTGTTLTAIATDGIFTFGASATLPANTALVVNSTTMATLVLGDDLTTTTTLKITGNAATLNVGGGLFVGGITAKYVEFPAGTFSVSNKSFTPTADAGAIDFEDTASLKLQNGATLVVGKNTFAAGASGETTNEIVFVDTPGSMVLDGTNGLKINNAANTSLVQAKGTALITSIGADADNYLKLTKATIGVSGANASAYAELKAGVLDLVVSTTWGTLKLDGGGSIETKGSGEVIANSTAGATTFKGDGTWTATLGASATNIIIAPGATVTTIDSTSAAAASTLKATAGASAEIEQTDGSGNGLQLQPYVTLDISDFGKITLKGNGTAANAGKLIMKGTSSAGQGKLITGSGTTSTTKPFLETSGAKLKVTLAGAAGISAAADTNGALLGSVFGSIGGTDDASIVATENSEDGVINNATAIDNDGTP